MPALCECGRPNEHAGEIGGESLLGCVRCRKLSAWMDSWEPYVPPCPETPERVDGSIQAMNKALTEWLRGRGLLGGKELSL